MLVKMKPNSSSVSISSAPRATLRPVGEPNGLAKHGGNQSSNPRAKEGAEEIDADERIVVAQFEVVACDQATRDVLHALRNVQHRMLNAAMRAWWESEGKDRAAATGAVQAVLENERAYWREQLPKIETGIEKLRAKKPRDEKRIPKWDEQMTAAQRQLRRAQVRATLAPPSAIYDACVYFTSSKYREYRKHAFRGDKSMASFRDGQPVRVRDGAWSLIRADRPGSYDLTVPIGTDGRRLERATMRVIPNGGSMYGWAKMLVDGEARPCDARIVYAEKKKQWFVKLTIAVPRTRVRAEGGTASARRGMHSAFVAVAENGDVLTIDGADVVQLKAKMNARRRAIGRHLRSGDIGRGSRGHGIKRRFAALARIDNAEKRFVDAKMKQWAAEIARWCDFRKITRLLLADGSVSEFYDKIADENIAPFVHQWPFAAMNNRLIETLKNSGVEVELVATSLDARSCPAPGCGHKNLKSTVGKVYRCDACGHERPADQIVAWNMLRAVVGDEPMKKREKKKAALIEEVKNQRD